jgi:hypothetical protein
MPAYKAMAKIVLSPEAATEISKVFVISGHYQSPN